MTIAILLLGAFASGVYAAVEHRWKRYGRAAIGGLVCTSIVCALIILVCESTKR